MKTKGDLFCVTHSEKIRKLQLLSLTLLALISCLRKLQRMYLLQVQLPYMNDTEHGTLLVVTGLRINIVQQ